MDEGGSDNISGHLESPSTDIILIAEGEAIKANKAALCKSSSYFSAMFRSKMRESFSEEISIHAVPAYVLRALVRFTYKKSIYLSMSTVYDVLDAACMLHFTGVINACNKYLTRHLSISNYLSVMFNASRNNLQHLYFRAKRRALWHFKEVRSQQEFWQLPLAALLDYLSSEMLRIASEREVLEAVYMWVMYSSNDRLGDFPKALHAVRLGLVTEEELRQVLQDEFVQASPEASEFVDRVLKSKTESEDLKGMLPGNFFKERHIDKEIWLIGGKLLYHDKIVQHSKIILFDKKDKKLNTKYDKLDPLMGPKQDYLGYSSCLVGKDLYLCGGEFSMGRNCWQLNVWKFDTFEETWEVVSQLPQPRRHLALVAMETDLYLIGGFGRHRIMLDSVEKYDTLTGDWSTAPCLNRAVYSAAACRHGDLIYVIRHDVQCYCPSTDITWTRVPMPPAWPLAFKIGIHTCVSVASKIYLVGSYIRDLIELDMETLRLTKLGTFKDACGPAVVVDDVIYVLGGEDAERVESYDLRDRTFRVECRIKVPLMGHSAVVVPCFPGYAKGAQMGGIA